MTSACLFDMIIDDKGNSQSIIPNKKRVKISNTFADAIDLNPFNLNLKKEDDLKRIFPFLSADLIEDILKKTSYNIEKASHMVHSLNSEQFAKNPNFVSIHQRNKKRRFNDLEEHSMTEMQNGETNFYQPSARIVNPLIINSNFNNLTINNNNNNINNLFHNSVNNKKQEFQVETEAEQIINYAKGSNSILDLTSFIKAKIMSYLSNEDKVKINETKCKLEKFILDNKYLKQALISIYSKFEESQIQMKEKQNLLNQIEELKNEIEIEQLKGKHLHNRLLLNDTSSRLNIEGPRDIY